jgi:hypothetical protein
MKVRRDGVSTVTKCPGTGTSRGPHADRYSRSATMIHRGLDFGNLTPNLFLNFTHDAGPRAAAGRNPRLRPSPGAPVKIRGQRPLYPW